MIICSYFKHTALEKELIVELRGLRSNEFDEDLSRILKAN